MPIQADIQYVLQFPVLFFQLECRGGFIEWPLCINSIGVIHYISLQVCINPAGMCINSAGVCIFDLLYVQELSWGLFLAFVFTKCGVCLTTLQSPFLFLYCLIFFSICPLVSYEYLKCSNRHSPVTVMHCQDSILSARAVLMCVSVEMKE